jgi:hypothetical protein
MLGPLQAVPALGCLLHVSGSLMGARVADRPSLGRRRGAQLGPSLADAEDGVAPPVGLGAVGVQPDGPLLDGVALWAGPAEVVEASVLADVEHG